ncbi:MAG TPA: caspase family protein [Puia sp.]|jgi:hypothetical protein|nr:caspase family protein [Puia sp.]
MIDKKALVIGIDAYGGGSQLYGAVKDATEFARLMEWNADDSENCEVHLHTNVPTRARLTELVTNFFTGDTPTAIFYYSGHGYVNELGGYIVTPDAQQFDIGVTMDTLLNIANASDSLNRVIILDCCNSGAFGESRPEGGITTTILPGTTVLTASRKDQNAMEVNGHGVFTNLLLEGLKGGAANLKGHITPASIYAYIDQALGEVGQRPVFKTNITRFVSLRTAAPPIPEKTLWKIAKYFPTPDFEFQLDPSYEDTNSPEREHQLVRPFALPANTVVFKDLQKMQSVGLVVPVDESFMYFAAMKSRPCRLTPLGQHYWRLAKKKSID